MKCGEKRSVLIFSNPVDISPHPLLPSPTRVHLQYPFIAEVVDHIKFLKLLKKCTFLQKCMQHKGLRSCFNQYNELQSMEVRTLIFSVYNQVTPFCEIRNKGLVKRYRGQGGSKHLKMWLLETTQLSPSIIKQNHILFTQFQFYLHFRFFSEQYKIILT